MAITVRREPDRRRHGSQPAAFWHTRPCPLFLQIEELLMSQPTQERSAWHPGPGQYTGPTPQRVGHNTSDCGRGPCQHCCGGPVGGGWLHLRAAAARKRAALLGVRHKCIEELDAQRAVWYAEDTMYTSTPHLAWSCVPVMRIAHRVDGDADLARSINWCSSTPRAAQHLRAYNHLHQRLSLAG